MPFFRLDLLSSKPDRAIALDSDLHAPLRGRDPGRAGGFRSGVWWRLAGLLPVLALCSLSVYTAFEQGRGLDKAAPVAEVEAAASDGGEVEAPAMPQEEDAVAITRGSPRPPGTEGPLLIEVPAARGNGPGGMLSVDDRLVEQSSFGKLPVRGADGSRPMDRYRRPAPEGHGTKLSIILTGLGLSQTGTQSAVKRLPPEITLAFAATGNSLDRWAQQARQSGHEILLQVPMEPFGYPANNPGPGTLLLAKSGKERLADLHRAMARITAYTGLINYQGGRLLSDERAATEIFADLSRRGLLFIDDGSSAQSRTKAIAGKTALPFAIADLTLDERVDKAAILAKLDELERIARRNGQAIGIASAFDDSVSAIAEWASEAEGRGLDIVGVSALVDDPAKR